MTVAAANLPGLHFISGLPRSGSTLLAGILRQNPRFHAAMTGPVGTLFGVMLNAMGGANETALFLDQAQKQALLRGLFETYYRPQAGKGVVFDTNRAWCARLPALRADHVHLQLDGLRRALRVDAVAGDGHGGSELVGCGFAGVQRPKRMAR